jgi:hypothetical protein
VWLAAGLAHRKGREWPQDGFALLLCVRLPAVDGRLMQSLKKLGEPDPQAS